MLLNSSKWPTPTWTSDGVSVLHCSARRILREVGRYYEALVYYEILRVETNLKVEDGEDFESGVGYAYFKDKQELSTIKITPLADSHPEFEETFKIRLLNVTGEDYAGVAGELAIIVGLFPVTKHDLQSGVLANQGQEVTLKVMQSDDPNGLIVFPVKSREVSVPEDVLPGNEAKTRASLTVERQNGDFDEIRVRS